MTDANRAPESAVTGLGGTIRGRYEDDQEITFSAAVNREVRIRVRLTGRTDSSQRVDGTANVGYAGGMPPTRRKTGEVRITGLDSDEEMAIKLAAVRAGKTIRDWALDHARDDGQTVRPKSTTPRSTD